MSVYKAYEPIEPESLFSAYANGVFTVVIIVALVIIMTYPMWRAILDKAIECGF